MNQNNLAQQFENLIFKILNYLSYTVEMNERPRYKEVYSPDLILRKEKLIAYAEVKFYKSRRVPSRIILSAAALISQYPADTVRHRILIVSSIVSKSLKEEIRNNLGVIVWDRSNIANFLAPNDKEGYLEDLGQFLIEAQQGLDIADPYTGIDDSTVSDPEEYFSFPSLSKQQLQQEENIGQKLILELNEIPIGQPGWADFEDKCNEILKYLFPEDLSVWNTQQISDDDLSRFDLICRISSKDDFWKTLIHSFNSRYILFEFKNYKDPLPQGQIYTTERYLFPKALRGTCILIARNGATEQALNAAKGALRESGKLILLLDKEDLEKMLLKRDGGDSPSDYLSDKIDEFLMSLSR